MRHRIKKIPTLSKLTSHHLLHSDKSTYFYNNSKVATLFRFVFHSTNDVRWTSPHHDKTSSPTETALVNRTRSSRETTSFSGIGSQTRLNTIPLVLSSIALLLVCGIMLSPSINLDEPTNTAYATESENGEEVTSGYKPRTSTSMTLTLDFNNTVQAKKEVAANTPGFTAVGMKITATGIDENGYALYVQAADGNTNSLVNSIDASKTINPVPSDTLGSELKANTWGYSVVAGEANSKTEDDLKSLTYSPVSPSGDISSPALYSKDELTASPYTLAFGANIGSTNAIGETMPVGSYKTNVLVSLAASADGVATLDSFIGFTDPDTGEKKIYMQDLDKATCDKLTIGDEWQLRDKRDEKIYWVAKLNDGLCWMTQNLDLDLTAEGLTANTTDLNTIVDNEIVDWNGKYANVGKPANTIKNDTDKGWTINVSGWDSDKNTVQSYDPGVYSFSNGTSAPSNGQSQLPKSIMTAEWITPLEAGLDDTWTATSDKTFIDAIEYDALNGKKICTKEKGSLLGSTEYIPCRIYYIGYLNASIRYNTHYLVGNRYSYNAATAGSGQNQTSNNKESNDSICPKNWKLPLSGSNNTIKQDAALGSFGRLLYNQFNSTSVSVADVLKTPLFFVCGGYVSGNFSSAGAYSAYWSSTVTNTNNAYNLSIGPSYGLKPTDTNNHSSSYGDRYYGFSVRCVTR